MRRTLLLKTAYGKFAAIILVLASTTPSLAGADCTCRFKGQDVAEGGYICMDLPSGPVLAKCSKVLNNTAWKTIQKGCPYGNLDKRQYSKRAS